MYTNCKIDTFVCCVYKTSCRHAGDDRSKLDIVHECIIKYKKKGHVMLMGDLDCRTGTADDYISTDGSRNFVNIINNNNNNLYSLHKDMYIKHIDI